MWPMGQVGKPTEHAHTQSSTHASLARCARLPHHVMVVHATRCSPCMCYAVLILIAKAFRLRHTKAVTWLAPLASSMLAPPTKLTRPPRSAWLKLQKVRASPRYLVACSILRSRILDRY
mgnify:CR=1 FL=1